MKKFLLIIILFTKVLLSFSQHKQEVIDSVQQIIPSLESKSLIAKAYYQIAQSYFHADTDSAVHYLLLSAQLASEAKDFSQVGASNNDLSALFRQLGQYDSALYYSRNSLKVVEQLSDPLGKPKLLYSIALIFKSKGQYDTAHALLKENLFILSKLENARGLAVTHNALGQLAEHQGIYVLALDYYYKALTIYQELGDKPGEAILLNNIGIVYENLEQYPEAMSNYNRYYQYNRKVDNKYRMAIGLKNAGGVLEKIGLIDSAIFNYNLALSTDSLLGSKESIAYDLVGLGSAHLIKKDFEMAFQYFHKTLKMADDPIIIVPALIGTGTIHMNSMTWDSAIFYLETAIIVADEAGLNNKKKEALYLLYELHAGVGSIERAFTYFLDYTEVKDSLFNAEIVRKTTGMKANFEFEKKREDLEMVKKLEIGRAESIRNIFIVGTFLSAIIAFLLFIIYRRKAVANQKLNGLFKTVRNQAEELKALDQNKSNFYSNISHELRTPLTLISSPLEYLLTHQDQNTEVKYHLELMDRNTRHLKALVDDILDFTKLESNNLETVKKSIVVPFFIKRIFSSFEILAKLREIDFQLELDSLTDNIIQIDQSKLEKILNNLLSNAFKYTTPGGTISLRAENGEGNIYIKVEDNGQGIDAKDLPFIFDRYFQSKQPSVAIQGGSGIGLALSKELTRIIGGQLKVKSEKGIGSVFTLSIPCEFAINTKVITQTEEQALPNIYEPSLEINDISCNMRPEFVERTPTILVVEDHPEMQEFVKKLLKPIGGVHLTHNGQQALNMLSNKHIDLIITDVMMPEMDGFEFLNSLRQKESYSYIPVIMLTALRSETHLLKALSIGVDDYLVKPFSPSELIARVKNMIERQKFRKAFIHKSSETNLDDSQIKNQYKYKLPISDKDREFIEQLEEILLSHLEDEGFNLKDLADIFCLSYRQMERNIKNITGLTIKQLQQEVALQRARKLLEESKYDNSTAIAYSVGIRHVTRFSNLYEKRFGRRPESYFQK